jgi:uncharacterized protein (TIGR03085 family)
LRRVPNLNELFVHHEDVRRANGGRRRDLEPAMDDALWSNVTGGASYLARRLRGPGLELRNASTDQTMTARRGDPVVRVTGEPGEVLLYLFGRREIAEVEVDGPRAALGLLDNVKIGL